MIIVLSIYVYTAYKSEGRVEGPEDFLIGFKQISTEDFSSSSVAYGVQVATFFPFVVWGASYTSSIAIANLIMWGIGIYLFRSSLPSIDDEGLLDEADTLHGFIGEEYKRESIRYVTSLLTIVGLMGIILTELVWGASVLKEFLSAEEIYFVVFAATFYTFVYVSQKGHLSAIATDRIQVFFTYIGIFSFSSLGLFVMYGGGFDPNVYDTLSILYCIIFPAYIIWSYKGNLLDKSEQKIISFRSLGNLIVILLLIFTIVLAILNVAKLNLRNIHSLITVDPFGHWALVAAVLTALFWQFSDMTMWQRVLAVKTESQEDEQNGSPAKTKPLEKGIKRFSIESPLTWMGAVVIGYLILRIEPAISDSSEIFAAIPSTLIENPSVLYKFIGYIFIISIVSIMLSTVDSVVCAVMFTWSYDARYIFGSGKEGEDATSNHLMSWTPEKSSQVFTAFAVLAIVSMYIFIDAGTGVTGESFISIMFTFYNMQLSFAVPVIGMLLLPPKYRPNGSTTLIIIISSALVGIVSGLYPFVFEGGLMYISVPLTIATSLLLYGVSSGFKYARDKFSIL